MATDNRPLSPHLQVYKPQLTSVLSIMHRATGIVLTVGVLYMVCWLLAAASSPERYDSFQWFAGSFIGRLFLFGWTVCLFYHFCNGIRHLMWDSGRWLELDEAYKSGWGVVIGTVVLTLVAWIWAYASM